MSIAVTGTTLLGNEVQIGSGASKRVDINLEDVTDSHGRAEFVIDTPGNIRSMKIKARRRSKLNIMPDSQAAPSLFNVSL